MTTSSPRLRVRLAGVLVLLAASGLAACGSDDSSGDSSAGTQAQTTTQKAPPTKAAYIVLADQACRQATAANHGLGAKVTVAAKTENANLRAGKSIDPQLRTLSGLYTRIAGARDDLTGKLRALTPPATGAPVAYLKARDATTAAITRSAQAARNAVGKPVRTAVALQDKAARRANAAAKRSLPAARAYGLKVCERPLK
jgi:hypothetical protein